MWIRYLAVVFIILSLAFAVQAASQNIIALQGRAVNSTTGQLLSSGSVTLRIYSAPTGGTLAYEENFTSAIFNGTFNVVAGNSSSLSLLYNTRYWLELRIGSIEVIGSSTGAGRQPFYPTSGPADATEINISSGGTIEARLNVLSSNLTSVNTSLAVLNTRQSADNATLSNRIDTVSTDSGVLSSNLTAVNTSLALVNARQSADNTTLTNLIGTKLNLGGGTMTGNLNVSGYFGDFLTLTVGSLLRAANVNSSGYGDFDILNVRTTSAFGSTITSLGNILVGGGYGAGGITLKTDGDILINGSLFMTGNITVQDITNINITGGLYPSIDDNFGIGLSRLRWNALYVTGANITSGNYNASGYADVNNLNVRGLTTTQGVNSSSYGDFSVINARNLANIGGLNVSTVNVTGGGGTPYIWMGKGGYIYDNGNSVIIGHV